ncbi:MAG: hypothetical protein QM778_35745 [Myxococcales bacterium]
MTSIRRHLGALLGAMAAALWAGAAGELHAQDSQSKSNKPLACAVVGTGSTERSEQLCLGLGQQLGRHTVLVDDGSNVRRGESIHIVQGDVAWTVVWLKDGSPRAFTRVSAVDAAGREVLFLARASRVLSREANKPTAGCVRVEPNGGRVMRSPDLAYPWVSLKRCRAEVVDVIDPWWTSPHG